MLVFNKKQPLISEFTALFPSARVVYTYPARRRPYGMCRQTVPPSTAIPITSIGLTATTAPLTSLRACLPGRRARPGRRSRFATSGEDAGRSRQVHNTAGSAPLRELYGTVIELTSLVGAGIKKRLCRIDEPAYAIHLFARTRDRINCRAGRRR